MMHKSLISILCNCLLCLATNVLAQDSHFSQFYANRLNLNPAWAGVGEENRVFINYRNQYPGIGSIYKTYTLSYDQYVENLHGGLGLSFSNDVQGSGAMNQMVFSSMYSYHFKASRSLSFSGGIQAAAISRTVVSSGFEFADQYDPATGTVNQGGGSESYPNSSSFFPDFSFGAAGFHNEFYGGVSLFHVLKPFQSPNKSEESRLPRKFTLFAGTYIPVYERRLGKEVLKLNPNVIYIQQKDLSQLVYGLESVYKSKYIAGLWLRQNLGLKYSSLIVSGGVVFDTMRLRYSYDAQFSHPTIQIPRLGAHEISLILLVADNKKIKHKAIKCPKI